MSFQQGLSGLSVSSKALDIISNNVANTNTIGFKTGSAIFSDVFAASLTGSISGKQVGVGATLGAVRQTFTQGNLTTTNNPLDLAINGDGFFVVSRENGPDVYTRNGQFELDKEGFIRTPTGERLKGFQSPVTPGAAHADRRPQGRPGADRRFPAHADQPGGDRRKPRCERPERSPALPTAVRLDLHVSAPCGRELAGRAHLQFLDLDQGVRQLGKSHELTYYFAKVTPTPNDPVNTNENTWKVFTSVDGGYPLGVGTDGSIEDPSVIWSLTFNEKGTVNTPIVGPTAANPLAIPASYTPGADRIRFHVDFSDMRQIGGSYLITELTQDGYTGGELAGVSVGRDGIVTGRYTNGETRELAQLALQTFRNPNALLSIGNNFWEATTESGLTAPSKAGEGVAGVVSAGMIEDANVELTNELVQMIVQQRNYQANAQSIKAQDQVLQTLVNLR